MRRALTTGLTTRRGAASRARASCAPATGSSGSATRTSRRRSCKERAGTCGQNEYASNDKLALARDAIVIHERGGAVDLNEEGGCITGSVANAFYGCMAGDVSHAPGKVTSAALGDVGWFVAPFVVSIKGDEHEVFHPATKSTHRAGGIVVKEGSSWKLGAVMYVEPISDKELLRSSVHELPTGDAKLAGDKKLAGLVASWFKTGFAANAAKQGTLIASGTAPSEMKTGAAATKLAKGWDKLKLVPVSVEATLFAGGKIGWVFAEVLMPKRTGKGAIAMQLAAVVVPDGDSWRWVSLMYQPPFEPGR